MLSRWQQYTKICEKDQYTIYTYLQQMQLNIRILYKMSRLQSTQYDIKITELKGYGIIYKYCENFQTFIQYMKDPNCTSFNFQKATLLVKETNRFGKVIQLASFKLQKQKVTKSQITIKAIQQLTQRCMDSKDLSNQQIRQTIGSMLEYIILLHQNVYQIKSCVHLPSGIVNKFSSSNNMRVLDQTRRQQPDIMQIRKQISEIKQKFQNISLIKQPKNQQIIQLRNQILQIRKQMNKYDHTSKSQELIKLDGYTYQILQTKLQRVQEKLSFISQDVDKKIDKILQRLQNFQLFMNFNSHLKPIKGIDFVDPFCVGSKFLQFSNYNIINQKDGYCYIYSKIKINNNSIFTMTCRFNRILQIGRFGIIDEYYKLNPPIQDNCINYSSSGSCYVGFNKKCGEKTKGFRESQQVEMIVDIQQGNIEWRVRGQTRKKIQGCETMKKNINVNWVPFVYLNSRQDSFCIFK